MANQKGGVGKTTTVHALGTALAQAGRRVLLVDLDPQACLTYSVGLDPESLPRSLHDVLVGRSKAVRHRGGGPISVLPAAIDLAGSEVHLVGRVGREHAVGRALEPVKDSYDVVLLDCPPSLGILTINGLTAADFVLIPLQCETLSHRGVGQLLETVADVRAYTQPDLSVLGAVATMFDGRTRHTREVLADVEALRAPGAAPDDPALGALRRGAGDRPVDPRPRTDIDRCRRVSGARADLLTMLEP